MGETKEEYIKRNRFSNNVKAGATAFGIGSLAYGGGKIKLIKHENKVRKHATSVEKGQYSSDKFRKMVVDPNKKLADQKINNFNEKGKFQINSQKASNANVAPKNKNVINLNKKGFDPRMASSESRSNQIKFINNKHNRLKSFIKPMIDNTNKFNDQIRSNRLKATPTPKTFMQALHNVTNPNPPQAEIKDFKVPKNPKASNQNYTKGIQRLRTMGKIGKALTPLGLVGAIMEPKAVGDSTLKGYKRKDRNPNFQL